MKQIDLGWMMYMQDYDETWIFRVGGNAIGKGDACAWRWICGKERPFFNWWDVVQPYTRNNQIVACPSAPALPGYSEQGISNLGLGLNVYPTRGLVRRQLPEDAVRRLHLPRASLAAITKPAMTVNMVDAGKLWNPDYATSTRSHCTRAACAPRRWRQLRSWSWTGSGDRTTATAAARTSASWTDT